MNISVRKLAELAGVSSATVSMVLNNKPGISAPTRDHVLTLAKEYGYEHKPQIKAPALEDMSFLLVMWNKTGNILNYAPFFSTLTEGITDKCSEYGCNLNMFYLYENRDIQSQIDLINQKDNDGIIVLATEMQESDLKWLEQISSPLILLDTSFYNSPFDCVCINNFQATYTAVNYLLDLGHKTIGYFKSNEVISNFKQREEGYWAALHHAGQMSIPVEHVHTIDILTEEIPDIASKDFTLADAYIVDDDVLAAMVIKAFHSAGYVLPDDASIIGIDDMPLCDMLVPSLTTMQVNRKELGATAVRRLLERIKEPQSAPVTVKLDTVLKIRKSTSGLLDTKISC